MAGNCFIYRNSLPPPPVTSKIVKELLFHNIRSLSWKFIDGTEYPLVPLPFTALIRNWYHRPGRNLTFAPNLRIVIGFQICAGQKLFWKLLVRHQSSVVFFVFLSRWGNFECHAKPVTQFLFIVIITYMRTCFKNEHQIVDRRFWVVHLPTDFSNVTMTLQVY